MSSIPKPSERALQLLKALVERYIQEGQPVGSRALSRESGMNLSPATIRNIMADLEDYGLITAPHTSAGRVPTVSGYRAFVDSIVSVQPLNIEEMLKLQQSLPATDNPEQLLEKASRLLSELSQMAGVVALPKRQVVSFRHIEFLPLSHNRVLVILVTNKHEVQNMIIHPSRAFSASQLQQAANYLNEIFEGKDLTAVRKRVEDELQHTRRRIDQEMFAAIEMASLALQHKPDNPYYVMSGETNLMDFNELADTPRLRQLFDAFHQKQDIAYLLDQCLSADGVQIFIGEESGYDAFGSCSMVTATYSVDDHQLGVLGVIGPTRMEYKRMISLVDVTSKILGAALNSQN